MNKNLLRRLPAITALVLAPGLVSAAGYNYVEGGFIQRDKAGKRCQPGGEPLVQTILQRPALSLGHGFERAVRLVRIEVHAVVADAGAAIGTATGLEIAATGGSAAAAAAAFEARPRQDLALSI